MVPEDLTYSHLTVRVGRLLFRMPSSLPWHYLPTPGSNAWSYPVDEYHADPSPLLLTSLQHVMATWWYRLLNSLNHSSGHLVILSSFSVRKHTTQLICIVCTVGVILDGRLSFYDHIRWLVRAGCVCEMYMYTNLCYYLAFIVFHFTFRGAVRCSRLRRLAGKRCLIACLALPP